MRKYSLLIILIISISCSKKNDEKIVLKRVIIAGDLNSNMILYDLGITLIPQLSECLTYIKDDTIDVDFDGINDFEFYIEYRAFDTNEICSMCNGDPACDYEPWGNKLRHLSVLSPNFQIWIDQQEVKGLVRLLNNGDTIKSNGNWVNAKDQLLYFTWIPSSYDNGYWRDIKNGYIGVRKIIEKDTLYGWINIDLNDTCFIKQMALEIK